MAKKVSKKADKAAQQVENVVSTQPTVTPLIIVAQRKFERWYVYFQGVAPKDNVGCGCKPRVPLCAVQASSGQHKTAESGEWRAESGEVVPRSPSMCL